MEIRPMPDDFQPALYLLAETEDGGAIKASLSDFQIAHWGCGVPSLTGTIKALRFSLWQEAEIKRQSEVGISK